MFTTLYFKVYCLWNFYLLVNKHNMTKMLLSESTKLIIKSSISVTQNVSVPQLIYDQALSSFAFVSFGSHRYLCKLRLNDEPYIDDLVFLESTVQIQYDQKSFESFASEESGYSYGKVEIKAIRKVVEAAAIKLTLVINDASDFKKFQNKKNCAKLCSEFLKSLVLCPSSIINCSSVPFMKCRALIVNDIVSTTNGEAYRIGKNTEVIVDKVESLLSRKQNTANQTQLNFDRLFVTPDYVSLNVPSIN